METGKRFVIMFAVRGQQVTDVMGKFKFGLYQSNATQIYINVSRDFLLKKRQIVQEMIIL